MGSRFQPPSANARLELADRAWVAALWLMRRVSAVLIKTGHRQSRHVLNIGIGEAPPHVQHRPDTFQKDRPALDRHSVRSGRDDFKLVVGQRNHVPDDNPEKTFCGKHGPGKFQGAVAKA